jgi:hypothetical protein
MNLTINGKPMAVPDAQRDDPLVWVLRDTLGLVGTRYGCGAGVCGSCNVLVNGQVKRSCQTKANEVSGKDGRYPASGATGVPRESLAVLLVHEWSHHECGGIARENSESERHAN